MCNVMLGQAYHATLRELPATIVRPCVFQQTHSKLVLMTKGLVMN